MGEAKARARRGDAVATIHQRRITLLGTDPPVWRRVRVDGERYPVCIAAERREEPGEHRWSPRRFYRPSPLYGRFLGFEIGE